MIATELIKILEKLPSDVFIETDSGWECDATEVNTAYYSSQKKCFGFNMETARKL